MRKALSYDNIVNQKFEEIPFTGRLQKAFGNPAYGGVWFIWGDSANGKSSLVMQLAKQFCLFDKDVLYDALEEYKTKSFQDRVILFNMAEVKHRFKVIKEQPEELLVRIAKKRGKPDVIFLDSIQYLRIRKAGLLKMFEDYPEITWIVVSQSENGVPRGALAKDAEFEAYIKVYVDQYIAYFKGRATAPKDGGTFNCHPDEAEKLGHQLSA